MCVTTVGRRSYLMERMSANGFFFHRTCFRCTHCNCQLKIGGYSLSKGEKSGDRGKFFCTPHYRQLFLSNPEAINYSRAGQGRRDRAGQDKDEEQMEVSQPPTAVEPVKPVPKLDKLVEEEEEEGGKMEAVKNGSRDREMEVPSSPVVIVEPPTVEEEKERKKSRKWTFSKKNKKADEKPERAEKVEEGREEEGGGLGTEAAKEEAKSEEEEVRERERVEEREKNVLEKERGIGEEEILKEEGRMESGEREGDREEREGSEVKAESEGREEEGREGEKERERRSLCERERRRWSTLNENESSATVQTGHLQEDKIENGPIENEGERREMEGGRVVESKGEFAVFERKERERRGKKREWGRGTEREREEREIAMEIERSTLQITTCLYGGVAFKKRLRAPSNVQKLTATYEMKEKVKEETLTRSSRLVNRNKYRSRGGQKSIVRPMRVAGTSLENTDVMIQVYIHTLV
ncbi:[F-actin]-monooxygenase MICAL3 [Geodia barretti]|uniref:[F-actin]-monooxygenase MICAL3 n=1 Tax=Geodia barretti TaxID=519541 RepID=A0AA35WHK7_GEOBA|nr:[F-actin]-monooxygenase MICAL3 [Geodia barretti]